MSKSSKNDVGDEMEPIDNQFSALLSTLSQFKTQITCMATQLKSLEKTVRKEIKQHKREIVKKQQSKANKKPSGFAQASLVSNDLANFLGKEPGTTVARTEVTKFVCNYIRQNDLTNENNKRVINPDDKLKTLLGVNDDTVVTYFNLQRFMNRHFVKNDSSIDTNIVVASEPSIM
jgi:chromatin remodeling complex protein RSC6